MSKVGTKGAHNMQVFYHKSHFWGRLTHLIAIFACLSGPMYLSFVVGAHPGWDLVILGLIGYAGFVGILWVVEPIIYFPVLGTAGTYLSFLNGNTSNLNIPCAVAAQEATNAKMGTHKAEVATVIGISVAVLVNTVIIVLSVLVGTYIISIMPPAVERAFDFILPAIFGAVLGQFSFKAPLYGGIGLIIGLLVLISPIHSLIKIAVSIAITITVIHFIEKQKEKNKES